MVLVQSLLQWFVHSNWNYTIDEFFTLVELYILDLGFYWNILSILSKPLMWYFIILQSRDCGWRLAYAKAHEVSVLCFCEVLYALVELHKQTFLYQRDNAVTLTITSFFFQFIHHYVKIRAWGLHFGRFQVIFEISMMD